MTPEEAIERLEYLESALDGYPPETGINDVFAAIDTAIEALKEIQQYREIGTVEECREVVEKRLPDNNENVLVTTDMGLITSGYIAHGTWITDQEPDYPIAWRPLPEPYRPERSDNHDGE